MKTPFPRLCCVTTAFFATLAAPSPPLFAQAESTTDPVGLIELTIKGTGGTKATELTLLSISMTRPVAYQNTAETVSGTTLNCSTATWTDNQYASTPKPGYFLEVFSGAKQGLLSQIVSCSGTNQTLTVADNLTSLGVEGTNVVFKIRPNWSLATLFGSANTAGFYAGNSSNADLILIYNPTLGGGAGGYDQYYYSNVGGILLGTGWRKLGNSPANQDQGPEPISLDEALIIKRTQSADLTITLPGAVKLGKTITTVSTGANFIGNIYPSGVMTLGLTDANSNPKKFSSGLYSDPNGVFGVKPGNSGTADIILIYNPTLGSGAGGYDQYYYSNVGGILGNGWRKIGSSPAAQDQAPTVLNPGQAMVLKRSSSAPGPFNWVLPQPFDNP